MTIDDQVNLEELEESKRWRALQETRAEGDMPVVPPVSVRLPQRAPKQWIREARKWLRASGRIIWSWRVKRNTNSATSYTRVGARRRQQVRWTHRRHYSPQLPVAGHPA